MDVKKLKNIENYKVSDLLLMFGLNTDFENVTESEIKERINVLKQRFPNLARSFLSQAETKILEEYNKLLEEEEEEDYEINQNDEPKELKEWWQNEYLKQNNEVEDSKVTQRKNKVKTFDDKNGNHFQMKREQLGVLNAYAVPVVQGSLNPTLKNTTSQIVVLDSQFRQNISPYTGNTSGPSSATDYTFDLSDPLVKVLSLKLYSVQIPYTWYTIDRTMGTSCFWVTIAGNTYLIQIDDGNYSPSGLISAISAVLKSTIPGNGGGAVIDISYNSVNGTSSFISSSSTLCSIIFYDSLTRQDCSGNPCGNLMKLNYNMGYILGFRPIATDSDKDYPITFGRILNASNGYKVISQGPVDTFGTRYLLIVLDDFNQNHLNKGLVNISDTNTTLSVPSYYNADINYVCANTPGSGTANPVYIPNSPRTLTQNQLYSLNQILDNRNNTYKYRTTGPTTTDVFALIPIKSKPNIGDPIVDYGSSLMYNGRTYFGPVNISRMKLVLQDSWGNTLNLHGNDWSISIVAELLYEY